MEGLSVREWTLSSRKSRNRLLIRLRIKSICCFLTISCYSNLFTILHILNCLYSGELIFCYFVSGILQEVSEAEYNSRLMSIGINVNARNFMIFQGQVESVAALTPKERTVMLEELSGSVIAPLFYNFYFMPGLATRLQRGCVSLIYTTVRVT